MRPLVAGFLLLLDGIKALVKALNMLRMLVCCAILAL